MAPESPSRHIPELQSIRGIAAMIVVVSHCISYYATPPWWTFVKRLSNSQVAVEIFFILSGLVLTMSLVRKPLNGQDVAIYYVKRVFRIYPALWICSLFATLYVAFLHYNIEVPGVSRWMTERFREDRFAPLYFIASWAGMLAYLIPPVWTIFVELVASFLLPGLVLLLQRARPAFWAMCGLLLVLSIGLGGRLYYHIDIYLFDFALGAAMVAVPASWMAPLQGKRGLLWSGVIVCAVLAMTTRAFLTVGVYDPWMHLFEAILLGAVIFAFGRAGLTSTVLRSRILTWLGDVSYSIYLVHFTVMCVLAKLGAVLMPELPILTQGWGAGLFLAAATTAVTLPLSHMIYNRVEKPGIAAGQRVATLVGGLLASRSAAHSVPTSVGRSPLSHPGRNEDF